MTQASFASDNMQKIPPALLNSADIRAYAELGEQGSRLFEPFYPDDLKSASYEIRFLGSSYSWLGEDPSRDERKLTTGTQLIIPKNGIVFISPVVEFRVPEFLALRFNLSIKLVHRGLLLGTGPLVDPGFEGRLLIPVHNLTSSPVTVFADDGFIWVEVTKISPYPPESEAHSWQYVPFRKDKKWMTIDKYFDNANKGLPIKSSIPAIAEEASSFKIEIRQEWKSFSEAKDNQVRELQKSISRLRNTGIVAGIAASVGIVIGIFFGVYQIVESTKQLVLNAQQYVDASKAKGDEELRKLGEKVLALEGKASGVEVNSKRLGERTIKK